MYREALSFLASIQSVIGLIGPLVISDCSFLRLDFFLLSHHPVGKNTLPLHENRLKSLNSPEYIHSQRKSFILVNYIKYLLIL